MDNSDIFWVTAFLVLIFAISFLHIHMRCYVRDKPTGMKSLHDTIFKDTISLTQMSGSIFCAVAIMSRFELVRLFFNEFPLLRSAVCALYIFAFVSVGVNHSCICIVRILCIINMTFMEESLGERLTRMLTVGATLVTSGTACLIFFLIQDIDSGTPMSLLTNSSIPTGDTYLSLYIQRLFQ